MKSLRDCIIALVFLAVGVNVVSGCYHAGFEDGVKAGQTLGYDEAARHFRAQGLKADYDATQVGVSK